MAPRAAERRCKTTAQELSSLRPRNTLSSWPMTFPTLWGYGIKGKGKKQAFKGTVAQRGRRLQGSPLNGARSSTIHESSLGLSEDLACLPLNGYRNRHAARHGTKSSAFACLSALFRPWKWQSGRNGVDRSCGRDIHKRAQSRWFDCSFAGRCGRRAVGLGATGRQSTLESTWAGHRASARRRRLSSCILWSE